MPVRLLLLVALYCGVSVMHVRRILSYIKRKKVRDMTEKESDAFEDTDVWERGQVFVIFCMRRFLSPRERHRGTFC